MLGMLEQSLLLYFSVCNSWWPAAAQMLEVLKARTVWEAVMAGGSSALYM
jgi:hypothetical protein